MGKDDRDVVCPEGNPIAFDDINLPFGMGKDDVELLEEICPDPDKVSDKS